MSDLITPVAAFALGTALARANSCTVASTRRLVIERRSDWLLGLLVAISWSGLTLSLFALAMPGRTYMPMQMPIALPLAAGGVLLGVGATLNGGCFLGSVRRLGRGDLNYLFTLAGIALAMAVVGRLFAGGSPHLAMAHGIANLRPNDSIAWATAVFAPIAAYGLWQATSRRRETKLALIAVGVAGGVVYACNPDWSYTTGLARAVQGQLDGNQSSAETGAVALVCGVIVSSALKHEFALRRPRLKPALGCLFGGALMGTGAMLIPGGNDTLMLWAIPGLTAYGPAAYAIMIATIAVLMLAWQRFGPEPGNRARGSKPSG
ncbi:MAG: hypothetical protein EPO45_03965 [Sphingobium sp.]|nr:MAG: hypothetical protein EPO45_03965 [Sphingobium sp.]